MPNAYVTREELKNEPYNLDIDNTFAEVLQDLTKTLVDNLCGKSFDVEGTVETPVEKKISGNGKDTIFLPKELITLSAVRIYSSEGVYVEYAVSEFNAASKYISWNVYSENGDNARFEMECFPEGSYNIGVIGIWGFATVPFPIKYLQAKLIKKIVEDKEFGQKFKSESLGDYSYTLNTEVAKGPTGDLELDLIIEGYRDKVVYGIG